jgi:hypothetical protein
VPRLPRFPNSLVTRKGFGFPESQLLGELAERLQSFGPPEGEEALRILAVMEPRVREEESMEQQRSLTTMEGRAATLSLAPGEGRGRARGVEPPTQYL